METFEQFCKNNMGWDNGMSFMPAEYVEKQMRRNYDIALAVQEKYYETYGGIEGPRRGDIVEFSDGFHVYHNAMIVESMYGNEEHGMLCICENGSSHTDGRYFSTSGGAFKSIHKSKLKYAGTATNMVWTWGCHGAGASQGIYFTLNVNKWIIPYDPTLIVRSRLKINGKGKKHWETGQEFPAVVIENSDNWFIHAEAFSSIRAFLAWADYVGYKYSKGAMDGLNSKVSNQSIERKYITDRKQIPKDGKPIKTIHNGAVRDAWVVTTDEAVTYYVDNTSYERAAFGTPEFEERFKEYRKYYLNPLGI